MTETGEFNRYGEVLENTFLLRTSPVAVKMLKSEDEIPQGSFRPKKDGGYHLAQCQAFALSRRDGRTVAMLREDHWCPAALMAYGMVPLPPGANPTRIHPYEMFAYGTYIGILTAPLKSASFVPDAVIVYANTAQLRSLLLSLSPEAVREVNGRFFPPSCAHAVVTPLLKGGYWVIVPDPGEYQRALCGEDEMMFAVPRAKMPALIADVERFSSQGFAYRNHNYIMCPDFPRPDFYKKMFHDWGLDDY
ncbi:MAG: DUF169 domain-containing protein [Dehalococcoidales bacterium]|nr:DUF169 domain-containing protein [Dehalococcoidales bacterium]